MVFYPGPVPIGDESYIERDLVTRVCSELLNQRWVLFLGPRQHGKSTTLIRVKQTISKASIPCVYIDLQQQPPFENYSEFVAWFVRKVAEQLDNASEAGAAPRTVGIISRITEALTGPAEQPLEPDAAMDDLQVALNNVLPAGSGRVVILVDEASNIQRDDWRNVFFGQLRGLSSARAFAEDTHASKRLTFLFAGTFRPETLIDEANSPFNVCEKIETNDLTEDEVRGFATKTLGETTEAQEIAEAIYAAVGGQPYLVQRLLGKVLTSQNRADALKDAIDELKSGQTDHITNLFTRYLSETKLADLVLLMSQRGELINSPADYDYAFLCTGGLAKRSGTKLVFRNAVYAEVAQTSPQIGNNDATVARAPVFPLRIESFQKVNNVQLREIAHSAQQGAVASYNSGSNRLALAGYGCSIEAILIDYLSSKTESEISSAGQTNPSCNLNRRFESYADPSSLRLVNLVKIANRLLGSNGQVPDGLREWRNLIHPGVATTNYMDDIALDPEVRAAAALHEIFLRDLPSIT